MSRTHIIGIVIAIVVIAATSVAYATLTTHKHPTAIKYYRGGIIKIDILRTSTPVKDHVKIPPTVRPGAKFTIHGIRVAILVNGTLIRFNYNTTLVLVIERIDRAHGIVIGKIEPLKKLETLYEIIMKHVHKSGR